MFNGVQVGERWEMDRGRNKPKNELPININVLSNHQQRWVCEAQGNCRLSNSILKGRQGRI